MISNEKRNTYFIRYTIVCCFHRHWRTNNAQWIIIKFPYHFKIIPSLYEKLLTCRNTDATLVAHKNIESFPTWIETILYETTFRAKTHISNFPTIQLSKVEFCSERSDVFVGFSLTYTIVSGNVISGENLESSIVFYSQSQWVVSAIYQKLSVDKWQKHQRCSKAAVVERLLRCIIPQFPTVLCTIN